MMEQNSSHPEGVSGDDDSVPKGQNSLRRARQRKSNAALQLALAGATWSEIAHTLGYPTPRLARVAVERSLEANLQSADRDHLRAMTGARLERLLRGVWSKAIDPDNPEHLIATSKAREVIADHRKLFGLDAPTEVIVHQPTRTELESWVARVVAEGTPAVEEDDIIDVEWLDDEPPALAAGG